MSEKPKRKRSTAKRVLMVVPLLVFVAVIMNWNDLVAIARGERTLKGVIYGITRSPELDLEDWEVPGPIGAEDAKVVTEVFLSRGDPCHLDSLVMGQALGTIDPERIRVVFRDTATEEGRERFREVQLGCEQGLAIAGKTKFVVPVTDPESDREEKTIYLTHDGGWDNADLRVILDRELKEAYGGEGLAMSAEQFRGQMAAGMKRCLEELQAADEEEG